MKLHSLLRTASLIALTSGMAVSGNTAFAEEAEEEATAFFDEIIVSAQRRDQKLFDVPISVAAIGQDEADKRGVANITDIARITPGLNLTSIGNTVTRVSVRGINSDAGAGTTGIYINDIPIQVRQIGFNAFDAFPLVFDLQRVEVLRGPQGTLFGAGSMGGTLRFITPEADLNEYSGYARGIFSTTESGSESYELGGSVGGPLLEDKIGFRASLWGRHQGGYIDRVTESQANPGTLEIVDADSNSIDSYVARLELKFAVSENFEITPSIFYQKQSFNDTSVFWTEDTGPSGLSASFADAYTVPLTFSNPGEGIFNNGENNQQAGEDEFYLASLKLQYDTDFARIVAIGSYYDREQTLDDDFTTFDQVLFTGVINGIAGNGLPGFSRPVVPGQRGISFDVNSQENYTLEVRLESGPDTPDGLNWVAGVFYSEAEQTAVQQVEDLFLGDILNQQFIDLLGVGLGPDPIAGFFGIPLVDGLYIYDSVEFGTDKQLAGFAQVDYEVIDNLTVTAGIRVSDTEFTIQNAVVGPVLGPFTEGNATQEETSVTPKFAVSYQTDDGQLFYASASKGFRIGGANPAVGLPCGVTDGDPIPGTALGGLGLSDRPLTYESDSLWSYEIGAKNTFLDGRLRTEVSVYHIDWSNITNRIQLAACGFAYTDNTASANIDGFEISASFAPNENWLFTFALGYADASFAETAFAVDGIEGLLPLVSEGDKLTAPPLTINLTAQYNFQGPGDIDYFIRVDYDHRQSADDIAAQNPANGSFDPGFTPNPNTNFVNLRFGADITEGFNLSAFVLNLTDEAPVLNLLTQPGGTLGRANTVRPRTFGLQGVYRF